MNPQRLLGFDILCEKNGYAYHPRFGWVAASVADRSVPATRGFGSVGCGMPSGVKRDRAVAVRGNPDHPASAGKFCP